MAKPGSVERASDRWGAIVLSVLLHGALVAAVGYTWWAYRQERPAPTLAIDATVVDAKSVPGAAKLPPAPEPPAPPPPETPPPESQPQVEPDGPPPPSPEELAKREQQQKDEEAQAAQAAQQEADRKRAAQEQQQEEALAQEKRAEEQRLAQQKQAEAQANAEREADLKRSLDQEIRADAARSSGALASWQSQITARIQRAWLKPPSARSGIECVLNVTQVPGGEVTNVTIGACNGDQAVRESIAAAVYRASPLPPPPDPTLFERNLVITFRPN